MRSALARRLLLHPADALRGPFLAPLVFRVKQVLVAEWLCEEFDSARLPTWGYLHVGRRALSNSSQSHSATRTCLRSEEHTSELQSRFDLVCRLLLEKKKIHKY